MSRAERSGQSLEVGKEGTHFFQTVVAPVQRAEEVKEDIRLSRRLLLAFQRVEVGREVRGTLWGLVCETEGATMDRQSVGRRGTAKDYTYMFT